VVSAPDNLTRLAGPLVERRPHPRLPDWELVLLDVQEVEPVRVVPTSCRARSRRAALEVACVRGARGGAVGPHESGAATPRGEKAVPAHRRWPPNACG
jgi:hypothetical protein